MDVVRALIGVDRLQVARLAHNMKFIGASPGQNMPKYPLTGT
jgi:hypothetical protein